VLRAKLLGANRKLHSDNYTLILTDDNIVVDVTVLNYAEPAYDAELLIQHSPSLSFVGRKISDSSQAECKPESNKSQVRCILSNPFKGKINLQIRFNVQKIPDTEREFFVDIQANT